jgi:dipeptidyl aminopeptidase/acylaminoacyl peptidase
MNFPFLRICTRLVVRLCVLLAAAAFCASLPFAKAQNLDKPLQTIDEEITAFSYSTDGRLVYSVYRHFKTKEYDLEHDDIWLQDANGKRRRLLEGQKFNRGTQPFSYIVNSFRWSPNGRMIAAELLTTTVVDDSGRAEDSFQTLLLEDSGREIRINKGDNVIPDAANATWLPDGTTIGFLSEAVKPRQLFSVKFLRPAVGALPSFYEGRTFRDVVWLPGLNAAIAVEQNRNATGPYRLQRLDLLSDDAKELATLDGYEGGLSVSPSGKMVAYFIDKEILEIRDLAALNHVARVRIGLGVYHWSPDESRILLKRAIEKKSGDLVWIDLPPLAAAPAHDIPVAEPTPIPVLRGYIFRDFALSPDGRSLAGVITGRRNLFVFPLPR